MTVADSNDDSAATIADSSNGGIRLLTYVTAYAGGRIPPFVVATPVHSISCACRDIHHTPNTATSAAFGTSNHPVTHAKPYTTQHIRQRPPPSSPFRLNHACQDIHDTTHTATFSHPTTRAFESRMPGHTSYAQCGNVRRIGTSNHPVTHATTYTTQHMRQHSATQQSVRLNHVCRDIRHTPNKATPTALVRQTTQPRMPRHT